MKLSILAALVAVTLSCGSAMAKGYGMAGCGLGSVIFGNDPGKIQVIAATTNGTSYSQTFGITSGTSNCVDPETSESAALFIENNRAALQTEAARGQGETIANLGSILGCEHTDLLSSQIQYNYRSIFSTPDRRSAEVRDSIYSVINSNSALSQTCRI